MFTDFYWCLPHYSVSLTLLLNLQRSLRGFANVKGECFLFKMNRMLQECGCQIATLLVLPWLVLLEIFASRILVSSQYLKFLIGVYPRKMNSLFWRQMGYGTWILLWHYLDSLSILLLVELIWYWLQIWDVLSNDEVVNIVDSASSRSSAARALVEEAVQAWKITYPTSKVDDCAVVCLFLDSNLNNFSTASSTEDNNKSFISTEMSEVSYNTGGALSPPALNRSCTLREGEEVPAVSNEEAWEQDELLPKTEKEWSALDAVAIGGSKSKMK